MDVDAAKDGEFTKSKLLPPVDWAENHQRLLWRKDVRGSSCRVWPSYCGSGTATFVAATMPRRPSGPVLGALCSL